MSHLTTLLVIAIVILPAVIASRKLFGYVTVYEWQCGLLYKSGKFSRVLPAGRHRLFLPTETMTTVDLRSLIATVVNQEILCVDSIALKISSCVTYKVSDPLVAMHMNTRYTDNLHLDMQLVMRELLSPKKVEEVLAERNALSEAFQKAMMERAGKLGLTLESASLKDITFPADVKKVYSQVVYAEKSAQALLAKSKAEIASLRALSNAARLIEDHPAILTLRTLQSISELGRGSGNTVVLGLPQGIMPLNLKAAKSESGDADSAES